MLGLVSGIYSSTGKLKAVNKQASGSVSYGGRRKKSKKCRAKRRATIKRRPPFPERERDHVQQMLGTVENAIVDNVAYRKSNIGCELGLRIGSTWYRVADLLAVGFCGSEWQPYSGIIGEDRCRVGLVKLREKFGLPISYAMRERSVRANANLECELREMNRGGVTRSVR